MGANAPEARHWGQAVHCRAGNGVFWSRKPGTALPAPIRPPNLPPAIPLFAFFSLALPDRNAYKTARRFKGSSKAPVGAPGSQEMVPGYTVPILIPNLCR